MVEVQRMEDDFVLVILWSYNDSSLSLPHTDFEIDVYAATDDTSPIISWVQPKESRQFRQSLQDLDLTPSKTYRVALSSRNVIGTSEQTTSDFFFPG